MSDLLLMLGLLLVWIIIQNIIFPKLGVPT
jgi:hypothetical protein